MFNIGRNQLLLILAGVFLGTLLYFAPRNSSEDAMAIDKVSEKEALHEHESSDLAVEDDYEQKVYEKLDSSDLAFIESVSKKASVVADMETKLTMYDSLVQLGIKKNIPPLVAKYTMEKAKAVPTEVNWMLAGDNYFRAFRLSQQQSKEMIEEAIGCYEKVLELNKDNLSAQTAIGVAYVEGASKLGVMPMKGIGILKEVLNKDPKNVNALTNLGYFAIQSGQYEKAVERFETVLEIDPENAEAYIYLTDIYLSQNKIEEGIKTLEKYKSLMNDPLVKKQVDEYIKEIRNK